MSWSMPPGPGQWSSIPTVAPPQGNVGDYSNEQWAAMQQQNWQWAQWQYAAQAQAQWTANPYVDKYGQPGVQHMGPPLPPPASSAPPPVPPPPDKPPPPPPPHENDLPLYGQSKQNSNQTAAASNQNSNNISVLGTAGTYKNAPQHNTNYAMSGHNWSGDKAQAATQVSQSDASQQQNPATAAALEKLAEEERLFEIQFKKWEEEIEKWKAENVNHPDKQAYKEYEERFEACRAQLLERKNQMNLNRVKLLASSGNKTTAKTNNIQINTAGVSCAPPQKYVANSQTQIHSNQNFQSNQNFNQPPPNHYKAGPQSYGRKTNQEPDHDSYGGYDNYNDKESNNDYDNSYNYNRDRNSNQFGNKFGNTENNYQASGSSTAFLSISGNNNGIPGLDLVPEPKNSSNSNQQEIIDITKEDKIKSTTADLSMISKGIHNILGDEKIMHILSMVNQQKGMGEKSSQMNSQAFNNAGPSNSNQWGMNQPDTDYGSQMYNSRSDMHSQVGPNRSMPQDFNNQNSNFQQRPTQRFQGGQQSRFNPYNDGDGPMQGRGPQATQRGYDNWQDNQHMSENQQYNQGNPANKRYQNPTIENNSNQLYPNQENVHQSFKDPMNQKNPLQRNQQFRPEPQQMPQQPIVQPPEPKWAKEPLFTPSIIVEYDHKPMRLKAVDFVEPVHVFDYNHKTKDGDKPKRFVGEFDDNLAMKTQRRPEYEDKRPDLKYKEYYEYSRDYEKRPIREVETHYSRRYADDRRKDEREKYSYKDPYSYRRDRDSDRYKIDKRETRDRSRDKESRKRQSSIDSDIHKQLIAKKPMSSYSQPKESPPELKQVVMIDDLLESPGRDVRPSKIAIILRGLPGSGKSFLAKLIRDKEAKYGGTVRILSIDDYFTQSVEVDERDPVSGKMTKKLTMKYEYDKDMENSYLQSLERSFRKSVTDGYFSFIIYDACNPTSASYLAVHEFATHNGFQSYICTMDSDSQAAYRKNIHGHSLEFVEDIQSKWEETPSKLTHLDPTTLLQNASIQEVHMEDAEEDPAKEADDAEVETSFTSKWEKMDDVGQLARLDGTNKPLRSSQISMEDYLQLDDWEPSRAKPGKKTVRWADIEEKRTQEKMRAIGFVVGQTDWNRMTDPTMGSSALTQTKFIERVRRN